MAEMITGTPFDDDDVSNPGLASMEPGSVVEGLAGNDVLVAFSNDTTLDGGPGNDSLYSFNLFPGPEPGGNTLIGGPGDDTLYGGPGDDLLNGDAGDDTLAGGSENDTLNGGTGKDSLSGDLGDDILNGDEGDDFLRGDEGDDTLTGGPGNDQLMGGPGADTFNYSFTVEQAPAKGETLTFTDWLSEKYGKDFGDELPDFEAGHHHHGHHRHHGRNDHHKGFHQEHHGKHHGHHDHHYKPGDCDDHQPQHWGMSQSFFAENYGEWLREVVVADLLAQGLDLDVNGDGKVGIRLNQNDPDGTPRIEGLTDEQLASIFGDRDEVTLRHGHHEHDRWYSNSYTSAGSEGETTVVNDDDGFDTIIQFEWGVDQLELNGLEALDQAEFESLFKLTETERDTDGDGQGDTLDTTLALADDSWGVTLLDVSGHTLTDFYTDYVMS